MAAPSVRVKDFRSSTLRQHAPSFRLNFQVRMYHLSDGIDFNSGSIATIRVAQQRAHLVVG
jgi:hypothetical protein